MLAITLIANIHPEYNIQAILDILGLVQGITLGILLIVLNYKHYRSTLFLGLFLFFYSLKLARFIPQSLNIDQTYPELFLLPFNFSWLLFPLFFVYTQQVSIFSNKKIKYWVLYPGILSIVIQLIIYFQPISTKLVIADSLWYELIFTFIGIGYSWGIGIWNLKLLNEHKTEVGNNFSLIEFKALNWARIFLIYSLLTSFIIHILYFISPQNFYFKIIFSIFDLIAIYWVAVYGVMQRNVLSFLVDKKFDSPVLGVSVLENKNEITANNEDLKKLMKRIDAYLKTSEAFVNTELTIIDLADELKVHPKKISASINTICDQNFNSYINQLRIKKAEELLAEKMLSHLSIEGIGKEVGFHSKSAFYSAFKKFTKTTPAKYKVRFEL